MVAKDILAPLKNAMWFIHKICLAPLILFQLVQDEDASFSSH
jgi:hypothetical protein